TPLDAAAHRYCASIGSVRADRDTGADGEGKPLITVEVQVDAPAGGADHQRATAGRTVGEVFRGVAEAEPEPPVIEKRRVGADVESPRFVCPPPTGPREGLVERFMSPVVKGVDLKLVIPEKVAGRDLPIGDAGASIEALTGAPEADVVRSEERRVGN